MQRTHLHGMTVRRALLLCALLGAGALVAVQPAAGQQGGMIRIVAPTAGSTVTAPVALSVDITGVPVKAAGEGDPNAYHYHALVDVDPATVLQAGQPIPTGMSNIIHTAEKMIMLPNLAAGQHTVTVVMTRTDHVPLAPAIQDRVTFTVGGAAPAAQTTPSPATAATPAAAAAPGAAPAATPTAVTAVPRSGVGGALTNDPRGSWLLVVLAGAVLLAATSRLARRT